MKTNDKFRARYTRPEVETDWNVGIDGLEHIVELVLFHGTDGFRMHMGWRDALEVGNALIKYAEMAQQQGQLERR